MSALTQLLDEYAASHRDPTNKRIHRIAVPIIVVVTLGLAHAVTLPVAGMAIPLSIPAGLAALAYYWRLSKGMAVAMAILSMFALIVLEAAQTVLAGAFVPALLAIFVVAWIAQFIGHGIEGKKPSFAKDLQFLLIGPLWLLADLAARFRKHSAAPLTVS